MTTIAIGGPVGDPHRAEPEEVLIAGLTRASFRYSSVTMREGFTSYRLQVAPLLLRAVAGRTDAGFVVEVSELGVLGYGASLTAALDDLRDAVRDYLTIVRDSGMNLAPAVAHHAAYVPLLDVPEESWIAAVERVPGGDDAADMG